MAAPGRGPALVMARPNGRGKPAPWPARGRRCGSPSAGPVPGAWPVPGTGRASRLACLRASSSSHRRKTTAIAGIMVNVPAIHMIVPATPWSCRGLAPHGGGWAA